MAMLLVDLVVIGCAAVDCRNQNSQVADNINAARHLTTPFGPLEGSLFDYHQSIGHCDYCNRDAQGTCSMSIFAREIKLLILKSDATFKKEGGLSAPR